MTLYVLIRRSSTIRKSNKIFDVHMVSWDFVMEIGCPLSKWMQANNIPCEQKGNIFYVLDANGQRTGKIYALVRRIHTDDTQKIGRQ